MTLPHYPYGDDNRSVPQPGPSVRPQEDSWASSDAYGMGTRYPWPAAAPSAPPGNLYMSESTSPWPSGGSPQPPPSPPPQQSKVGDRGCSFDVWVVKKAQHETLLHWFMLSGD